MDGNENMCNGTISAQMCGVGGHRHAVARHQTSTGPIDVIWSSFPTSGLNLELDGPGDHTIAHSDFHMNRKNRTWQHLRLPHPPKLVHDPVVSGDAPDWLDVASTDQEWTNKLRENVDRIWECWIGDVEGWLQTAGLLCTRRAEQKLGSVPRPVSGQHRMADLQDVSERQLSRHIRRLKEARQAAHNGVQPNPALVRKLSRPSLPADEQQALLRGHWGAALTLATHRLQTLLKLKHDEALRKWNERVGEVSGAYRWVKQDSPVMSCPLDYSRLLRSHHWRSCLRCF